MSKLSLSSIQTFRILENLVSVSLKKGVRERGERRAAGMLRTWEALPLEELVVLGVGPD